MQELYIRAATQLGGVADIVLEIAGADDPLASVALRAATLIEDAAAHLCVLGVALAERSAQRLESQTVTPDVIESTATVN